MNINDDEFAFLKYNDIIFASATPANSQASLEAKANNKPYHIVMSTTPGDLNTPQGKYAKAFFDNAAIFEEKMYDWEQDKILMFIKKNSRNNFVYISFSYKQLGRDEEWFIDQCRSLNMDLFKIKREILLQWNKSSDLSPFSEEQIMLLMENAKDPVATLMINDIFPLKIYNNDFNWHGNLMIGVDVSGGFSLDSTAVTIWNPSTQEIVATFKNNVIDTVEVSEFLYTLVKKYFINSTLVIERNSYGKTVIDILLRTDIAKNLYYEIKTSKAEKKINDVKRQTFESKETRSYGVNTDNKTRPLMIDLLREIVNNEYKKINSRELIDEIAGLERDKTGKIQHGTTTHDDMVFSLLVLRYVWAYGTNLGRFSLHKIKSGATGNYGTSDQEFIRQFYSVAKFNKSIKNTNQFFSSKIIEEYYSNNKIRENIDEKEKAAKQQLQSINKIMSLNKNYNNNKKL